MATVGYTPAPYEQVSEDMRDFVIFGAFDCAVSIVESRAKNDACRYLLMLYSKGADFCSLSLSFESLIFIGIL
jgi:hypothetical protein